MSINKEPKYPVGTCFQIAHYIRRVKSFNSETGIYELELGIYPMPGYSWSNSLFPWTEGELDTQAIFEHNYLTQNGGPTE